MKLNQIFESIHDKGTFKAVFLGGLPGSGKSTIISKITDGRVSPRIVNTDKGYEFLLQRSGLSASSLSWQLFGEKSKQINEEQLFHYLNGMLPLFIDGTSSNPGSIVKRSGILESIGYDISSIWVDTDVETAVSRMRQRERKVDEEFIHRLGDNVASTKQFLESRFGNRFIVVDNNGENFSQVEKKIFNIVNQFFAAPIQNPIGQKNLQELKENGQGYLVPTIYSQEYLKKLISVWYQT